MPKWTKHPAQPIRVAVLLFDRFSNLCLANCIEPLRAANALSPARAFEWRILTPDGRAARSSSGIDILADSSLAELGAVDYLLVLASYDHARHDTAPTRRQLRAAARRARVTVGMDTAPWLLASAGLLAGRRATVHGDLFDAFAERFFDVEASRARITRDGAMVTCGGAMSALELTLGVIADHLGLAARLDVEALFLHDDPGIGAARDTVADPLVRRALGLMREAIERPLPLAVLARRLSCQPRTLERRFRARLGAPPGTVYRHLRLSAARKMIEDSTLSVAEIALRCGYDSPAAMSRAFRRLHGAPPTALRLAHRG